ncbi:helix-turn-helix transcriptional regulator [Pseudogulbenkiania subflava]|uniref:Helix-turn-helix n=1 Tax=Pseudogulbenkiania subflava DSM 22618 TaxID=1123014 RepID=A0A1Y6CFJ7_9NEIS|nr:helix-turn-helix transcriptional regulator [Pseudogulbenkiania subflava]SMF53043.1 Helix-turn-helix [Pseudogulbenkiania subflava DSM 22618]
MTPLRIARKQKNLTQKALAQVVGVSQAHISMVESGSERASAQLAEKLVEVIGRKLITEEQVLYPERYQND